MLIVVRIIGIEMPPDLKAVFHHGIPVIIYEIATRACAASTVSWLRSGRHFSIGVLIFALPPATPHSHADGGVK
jgi:hypothetical protein